MEWSESGYGADKQLKSSGCSIALNRVLRQGGTSGARGQGARRADDSELVDQRGRSLGIGIFHSFRNIGRIPDAERQFCREIADQLTGQ